MKILSQKSTWSLWIGLQLLWKLNQNKQLRIEVSFCIFHILNEISQHAELMDFFLDCKSLLIFWGKIINCSQHFKKHWRILSKNAFKKVPHEMDLHPAIVYCVINANWAVIL